MLNVKERISNIFLNKQRTEPAPLEKRAFLTGFTHALKAPHSSARDGAKSIDGGALVRGCAIMRRLWPLGHGGFTLIEIIAVIGIITGGLVAVQTAIQFGLKNAVIASDGIVAAHLSEEGLELIRNIRDSNWAKRQLDLQNGTLPADVTKTWKDIRAGYYKLDYLLGSGGPRLTSQSLLCDDNQALNFDSATGLYSYSGAITPSKFRRNVTITEDGIEPTTYEDIASTVCWTDNVGSHKITLTERLYDWRP